MGRISVHIWLNCNFIFPLDLITVIVISILVGGQNWNGTERIQLLVEHVPIF